jgi:AcrR family transcriptional regulator
MARRGDHTFEELSSMILNAAYEILETEGFQKISTRKIATKIGYTVGTLYNVFQNLEDIFIHLNARTLDSLIKSLSESDVTSIKSLAYAYVKFSQESFNAWSLLFEYQFDDKTQFPRWYQPKVDSLLGIVANSLKDLSGKCSPEKTKESIIVIWSSIHGICILSNRGKLNKTGASDPKSLIDNLIDNYLKGLLA